MIINLFDLEKEFPNKLPDAIEGYYSSGARDEVTLKRNISCILYTYPRTRD